MDESSDLDWWLTELLLELPPNSPPWSHLVAMVLAWDALEPSWRVAVGEAFRSCRADTAEPSAALWEP